MTQSATKVQILGVPLPIFLESELSASHRFYVLFAARSFFVNSERSHLGLGVVPGGSFRSTVIGLPKALFRPCQAGFGKFPKLI